MDYKEKGTHTESQLSGGFMIQSLLLCCSNSFLGILLNQCLKEEEILGEEREAAFYFSNN